MTATAAQIRRAHAHAALLAARFGETCPAYLAVFERMEEEVQRLDTQVSALDRARALAGLKKAA